MYYNTFLYSFLLPVVAFIVVFKKAKPNSVVLIVIIYSVLFFFLNLFYDDISSVHYLKKPYIFFYTFFEYCLFGSILYLKIRNSSFKRLIILLSTVFFVFQAIYYFTSRIKTLDSIPIGIETILIFVYVIYYFKEQFNNPENSFIYSDYVFWILVGIMIYLGGSFFFYILANHLDQKQIDQYWTYTYITDILKNIFLTISVIMFAINLKKSSQNQKSSVPYLDMI
jgi:hypothetical protein